MKRRAAILPEQEEALLRRIGRETGVRVHVDGEGPVISFPDLCGTLDGGAFLNWVRRLAWTSRASPALTDLKATVIEILSRERDRASIRAVAAFLEDSNRTIRLLCVDALCAMGARESAGRLLRAARTADVTMRRSCLSAFGIVGKRSDARRLLKFLRDADPSVRRICLTSLEKLRPPGCLNAVAALLRDADPGTRLCAIRCIVSLCTKTTGEPSWDAQGACGCDEDYRWERTPRKVTRRSMAKRLRTLLHDPTQAVRRAAATAVRILQQ